MLVEKGYERMAASTIAICSIVRDCGKCLKQNIPVIEQMRAKFKDSRVIVFENDSQDSTKSLLRQWEKNAPGVQVCCEDFNQRTIPENDAGNVNKYFSKQRIEKMAGYRNKYLEVLQATSPKPDYVMVIDLDVERLHLAGMAHSFGLAHRWDVVTANGYSFGPSLKKRYHDTYALVESGMEDVPQTEGHIQGNQAKWSFMRRGMPLIPVYSAYGGMAIYKYPAIRDKRYTVVPNEDDRVAVKCEHFALHQQIQREGDNKVCINPSMTIRYQSLTWEIVRNYLKRKFG